MRARLPGEGITPSAIRVLSGEQPVAESFGIFFPIGRDMFACAQQAHDEKRESLRIFRIRDAEQRVQINSRSAAKLQRDEARCRIMNMLQQRGIQQIVRVVTEEILLFRPMVQCAQSLLNSGTLLGRPRRMIGHVG